MKENLVKNWFWLKSLETEGFDKKLRKQSDATNGNLPYFTSDQDPIMLDKWIY